MITYEATLACSCCKQATVSGGPFLRPLQARADALFTAMKQGWCFPHKGVGLCPTCDKKADALVAATLAAERRRIIKATPKQGRATLPRSRD